MEMTTGMIWKEFLFDVWMVAKFALYWSTWGLYNFTIPILTILSYVFWGAIVLGIILGIRKGLKTAKDDSDTKPR